jgi:flagellar M-ring protein FliF
VLPNAQDQLFSDNSSSSSAAVLLSNSATLDPNSVKGIAQLVASSVPGLQLNKVTITDSSGTPLWPNSDGTGSDGTVLSQQAANQKYDSLTAAQVGAMLTQTLGPNKAEVQVNGTVDANQATSDTLVYGKKGVPLQSQTQTESRRRPAPAAPTTTTKPTAPPGASTRPSRTR